jgi:hypothetical protein
MFFVLSYHTDILKSIRSIFYFSSLLLGDMSEYKGANFLFIGIFTARVLLVDVRAAVELKLL